MEELDLGQTSNPSLAWKKGRFQTNDDDDDDENKKCKRWMEGCRNRTGWTDGKINSYVYNSYIHHLSKQIQIYYISYFWI